METQELDVLSREELLSTKGGRWVIVDGEWVWLIGIDTETEDM